MKAQKSGRWRPPTGWFDAGPTYYEQQVARLQRMQSDLEIISDFGLREQGQQWALYWQAFIGGGYRQYLGIPVVDHILHGLCTLYIGRQSSKYGLERSKWANPFRIGRDGDREAVIAQFRDYVRSSPELMDSLWELQGHTLGCWCHPEACHGDVLVELYTEWADRQWHEHGFERIIGCIGVLRR